MGIAPQTDAMDASLCCKVAKQKRNLLILFGLQLRQGALETFHQIFYQKDSGVIADCEWDQWDYLETGPAEVGCG